MSSEVLVTGATGTVGSSVVDGLLAAGTTPRVATRDPEAARERHGENARYASFDLEWPETWGPTLDGVDRLFLMVPPSVGVGPVRSFVDAAARVGVKHVAALSVLGAEKVPVLPHRRVERHLASAGPAYTFLRAAYFMQNLAGIHRPELVERDEVFVPAGGGRLGFVDARDVGAVAVEALLGEGHENRAYDLTGPVSLSFQEVAAVFAEVLDRPVTYADPSWLAFARRMRARGVPAGLIAFMLAEYTVARLGFASRTTDDLARVLGREPTPLRTFVADERETFEPG